MSSFSCLQSMRLRNWKEKFFVDEIIRWVCKNTYGKSEEFEACHAKKGSRITIRGEHHPGSCIQVNI